jgi:hypothetical protein
MTSALRGTLPAVGDHPAVPLGLGANAVLRRPVCEHATDLCCMYLLPFAEVPLKVQKHLSQTFGPRPLDPHGMGEMQGQIVWWLPWHCNPRMTNYE